MPQPEAAPDERSYERARSSLREQFQQELPQELRNAFFWIGSYTNPR
jgi:hypothetical protein